MGNLLERIINVVEQKQGFKGRMRLAVRTGVPRKKAMQIEDSSEIVSKFKAAASEIIGKNVEEFL